MMVRRSGHHLKWKKLWGLVEVKAEEGENNALFGIDIQCMGNGWLIATITSD